jgi:hypothetical protein
MYKVPLNVLEGLINTLEQSNAVLKEIAEKNSSLKIQRTIQENEKQIQLIKINFGFNG